MRIEPTPARTSRLAASWAASPRGCEHADTHVLRLHDLGQVIEVAHARTADDAADLRLVRVEHPGDRESAFGEAAVIGECLTETPGSDDDDRPVMVEAEFELDLVCEEGDVVADTTRAVTAEIRQVLAYFCRVHPREFGELIARDLAGPLGGKLTEDAQIER